MSMKTAVLIGADFLCVFNIIAGKSPNPSKCVKGRGELSKNCRDIARP
jgi:hypothetical protein